MLSPEVDGGSTTSDVGTPGSDASVTEDGGAVDSGGTVDAGVPASDSGTPASDSGTPNDAGSPAGPDGGALADVGVQDAAPVFDGGAGSYQPLAVGASWTYYVVDNTAGAQGNQTDSFTAYEDVGGMKAGTMGFHYHKDKINGGYSDSWYAQSGNQVVIHRDINVSPGGITTDEEYYEPSRIRVDEDPAHLLPGAMWTETFTKTNIDPVTGTVVSTPSVFWTVEAVDELVTVPAGTFQCLRVVRNAGAAPKTYWFARGVGKVREQGQQTEELISFTVP